jgi:hypothetical protein
VTCRKPFGLLEEAPLPNFTIRLQTSPGKGIGESVNSLPPLKSPQEPLISGDTVPPTWTVEVPTTVEVNKVIDKKIEEVTARSAELEAKVEELTARIAKLEAKLRESDKHSGKKSDQPENQAGPDKALEEKAEAHPDKDKKAEAKMDQEKKPEQDRDQGKANSDQKSDSEKRADKVGKEEAKAAGAPFEAQPK